jgi:hypothetical protein
LVCQILNHANFQYLLVCKHRHTQNNMQIN